MYKNRIYIWLAVAIVYLSVNIFGNMDLDALTLKASEVSIDIQAETSVKQTITSADTGLVKLIQTQADPSVIVKVHSSESMDGFDKIENAIYSPIVMYVPSDKTFVTDIFYTLGGKPYFVNFERMAEVILNNETLEQAGLVDADNEMASLTITLNLPSRGTSYYDAVIEAMYYSLNGSRVPTEEERAEIKPTVDALLAKAVTCNSVSEKIDMETTHESYNVFIAPEYYLNYNISANASLGNFFIVYFEKSTAVSYDIYVRSGATANNKLVADILKNEVLTLDNFVNTTKYRTLYNTNMSGIFSRSYLCNQLDIAFID